MKILIINGSPKGTYSTTLQTVLYIEKHNPNHEYRTLNAGTGIRGFEKNFGEAADALNWAELIIFSYPVYTFLVPSQLHRFIELIKESGVDLKGKTATQVTTSKHFYDITAHGFIEENAFDLGMNVVHGLSADMDDLLTEKGRADALHFFDYVMWCEENKVYECAPRGGDAAATAEGGSIQSAADAATEPLYVPGTVEVAKDKTRSIAIVTDLAPKDKEIRALIGRFCDAAPYTTRIINLKDYSIKGGCIDCLNCITSGKCIYDDDFQELLTHDVHGADAIVIAFTLKDHSMGSPFKMFDDRQFCNGHRTVTEGIPFAYLVSGKFSEERNLRTVIEGRAEVGGNFLAGIVTDEFGPEATAENMKTVISRLTYAMEKNYVQPANFLGVGGRKIFRDLIYLMRGMMKADHKFYKERGMYDFPQKQKGAILKMYAAGVIMNNPKLKKKMAGKLNETIIEPYKKAIEEN